MPRDSIHISLSEPLRRAEVRPRLQKLAETTGLPVAFVAARALMHGLSYIESDLTHVFPVAAATTAQTAAGASDAIPVTAPQGATAEHHVPSLPTVPTAAPPIAAEQTADDQHAHAATTSLPHVASSAAAKTLTASPASQPALVTTKAAAAALGKSKGAFAMHLQRHPELRRHVQMDGRTAMWDLASLRAEYQRDGQPER